MVWLGIVFAGWIYRSGATLLYGDAEAHLNIARRLVDSKTPGIEQIGTTWLPLLHWVLVPFASTDSLWRSGLAGAIPSVAAFVAAGMLLYTITSNALGSRAAGVAAALAFALNPNLLYLQSVPMTEVLFLACEMALIAALIWFAQTGKFSAIVIAGLAGLCASLTRYEGWFLLAVASLVILITAKHSRWIAAGTFLLIGGSGPAFWLLMNRWFYSDWLEFYRGAHSHLAIQGAAPYPGKGDWGVALHYYSAAARECGGMGVLLAGAAGLIGVAWKRAWIPLVVMGAVPVFYLISIYSGGTPIQLPQLWPSGYYNSRYGIAVLPLAAFCAAGIVVIAPRLKGFFAAVVIFAAAAPWLFYPRTSNWVIFTEGAVNSASRRAYTASAATYLKHEYKRGDGIYSSFGDMTGILRAAGIPLGELMHEGNSLLWVAAQTRPDLFLWQRWVIVRRGDPLSSVSKNKHLELVRIIPDARGQPIEILRNEYPFLQSARRAK